MPVAQVITFIIGSALVIFGAYFVTYIVARGSQKVNRGRIIEVLDRFSLSKDKTLLLIAIYDKIYLVAFSGSGVTLLDNIDPKTAASLAADPLKPEDKPRSPITLAALLFSRLRRHSAPLNFPYEAYLPGGKNDQNLADSFLGVLHNSQENGERLEEDMR